VVAVATTGCALLLGLALRRLQVEQIPQTAMLGAMFFLASLISIPIGPGGVHLMFSGLMGLVLGWAAIPAILVGLLLQTVFVGHGGLLVLGVNALNIMLPALVCALLLAPLLHSNSRIQPFHVGAAAGALGCLATGGLVALTLAMSGEEFIASARLILISHLPVAVIEAAVSGACVALVCRVSPRLLSASGQA
jgi:cobalt/nickel transport system permease protein